MSDAILVAIITGAFSVFGTWLLSRKAAKEKETADAVRDAKLDMRLENVERKLDLHNGYAERFAEIQTDIAVIKNDIKNFHRAES